MLFDKSNVTVHCFSRGAVPDVYKRQVQLSYELALDLNIKPDNIRWIWPIPKAEIDANPQIKNQQNPGY